MPDPEKIAAVREALPSVGAGIYLDTPAAGPLPAESAAAMAEVAQWELTTGRAHRFRAEDVQARVGEARAAAAAILTAELDEVALAHGLDDALTRALRTVPWRGGDRLLVVDDPDLRGLERLAPPGVAVERLTPPGVAVERLSAAQPLDDQLERALTAGVRLVALPLVSSTTGARLPVEHLAAAARRRGVRVLVDVSLGLGAVPVEPLTLGADLVVARSEAWLLGPEGLAIVAGAGIDPVTDGFHLPSVAGFARGCGWLSMYVGLPWIQQRGEALTAHVAGRLASIDGVTLRTPATRATTLVFGIAGWAATEALDELGGRIFLLAGVTEQDSLRIGIGFWNTVEELDRLVEGVALLAAHTPATLPRRPRLAMLGEGP